MDKGINAATILPFIKEYHKKECNKVHFNKYENNSSSKLKKQQKSNATLIEISYSKTPYSLINTQKLKKLAQTYPRTQEKAIKKDSLYEDKVSLRKSNRITEPNHIKFTNNELISKIAKSYSTKYIYPMIKSPFMFDLYKITRNNIIQETGNNLFHPFLIERSKQLFL